MEKWISLIKKGIKGEAYCDPVHTRLYAVDASIFEIKPQLIVIPKTYQDIQHVIEIASSYHIPITVRGSGTSTTGAALGRGIIMDMTVYFNRILNINIQKQWVELEPGVIQDDLNKALKPYGYRLGPDTSSGSRASIGGMIANNSSGARSLKFKDSYEALLGISFINDASKLCLLNEEEENPYQKPLANILKKYSKSILKKFPKLEKQASGYCLDKFLNQPLFTPKIFAGSEGTLGVVVKSRLKIIKQAQKPSLWVIQFKSLEEALDTVIPLKDYSPLSLELIDEHIINLGKKVPHLTQDMKWLHPESKALLILEEENAEVQTFEKAKKSLQYLSMDAFYCHKEQNKIWQFRKSGLGLLMSQRSHTRGHAFIEDLVVAPDKLKDFVFRLNSYLKNITKKLVSMVMLELGCFILGPLSI